MPELTRRQKWIDLNTDQKANAAGDDLDENDDAHAEQANELKGIRNILMGLLISVSTGIILGAVGVLFGAV